MSCYVYMIKSILNGRYYVGISEDITRRLKEHNSGKVKTTSKNKPYVFVFKKEYIDYKTARKHEIWLKKKSIIYKNKIERSSLPRLFQAG
jgi:putative endonuclease